jgi:hypothetical protein
MLLVQLVLFLGCIVCVAVILAPDVALLLTVIPSQQAAAGPWIDGALLGFWFSRTGLQLRVLTHLFLSYAFLRPVAAILWLLDEWLYPEYRQVEIKAPIIIFSVQCTKKGRNNIVSPNHCSRRRPARDADHAGVGVALLRSPRNGEPKVGDLLPHYL